MPSYTIVNSAGGPVRSVHVADSEAAQRQLGSGESAIEGSAPPDTFFNGTAWEHREPRPSLHHAWTTSGWKDPRPMQAITAATLAVIRGERDRLLAETDWMVLRALETGTPVSPQWAAYRQALRDVPTQDPFGVVWPTPP